jgi:hypothetical protein
VQQIFLFSIRFFVNWIKSAGVVKLFGHIYLVQSLRLVPHALTWWGVGGNNTYISKTLIVY